MIKQTKILKFIIPIVVFILLYAVSTIRNNNVRKDGIYSIVTLVKYGSAYRGQSAKYEFIYNLKSASNLNGNLNCSKELEHYAS